MPKSPAQLDREIKEALAGFEIQPHDLPEAITGTRGQYTPKISYAERRPEGIFWAEHVGAGYGEHGGTHETFFMAKRKGSKKKLIGIARAINPDEAVREIKTFITRHVEMMP
jgi:hypothetical protein